MANLSDSAPLTTDFPRAVNVMGNMKIVIFSVTYPASKKSVMQI